MSEDLRRRLSAVLQERPARRVQLDDARDAAVLIPIVARPEPTLLLTVRTDTLSSHKGQIAFPGGAIDDGDASPVEAALREAHEEIGLDPDAVEVIGELDSFPTFVSGYVVTPVVGWIATPPELEPNPGEVAELLEVSLAELTDEIRSEAGFNHDGRTYPTEAWVWRDRVIWGVTARIVRSLLAKVALTGFVEPPGPTSSWVGFPQPEDKVS